MTETSPLSPFELMMNQEAQSILDRATSGMETDLGALAILADQVEERGFELEASILRAGVSPLKIGKRFHKLAGWKIKKVIKSNYGMPQGTPLEWGYVQQWRWIPLYRGEPMKNGRYYTFMSLAALIDHVSKEVMQDKLNMEKIAESRAAGHPYKVGTIMVHSWGYDQTNVDFVEVIEVKGDRIKVQEISRETVATETWGSYRVRPVPGSFGDDKPITLTVKYGPEPSVRNYRITEPTKTHYMSDYR